MRVILLALTLGLVAFRALAREYSLFVTPWIGWTADWDENTCFQAGVDNEISSSGRGSDTSSNPSWGGSVLFGFSPQFALWASGATASEFYGCSASETETASFVGGATLSRDRADPVSVEFSAGGGALWSEARARTWIFEARLGIVGRVRGPIALDLQAGIQRTGGDPSPATDFFGRAGIRFALRRPAG